MGFFSPVAIPSGGVGFRGLCGNGLQTDGFGFRGGVVGGGVSLWLVLVDNLCGVGSYVLGLGWGLGVCVGGRGGESLLFFEDEL
ncbi:hypothetical protein Tco_0340710 [Tanacetum coccineum]